MTPMTKKRVTAGTSSVLNAFIAGALEGSEAIDKRARKRAAEILKRGLAGGAQGSDESRAGKGV